MASILVIEDSMYTRSKIRDFLSADNHEIAEANNGTKGLEMALASSPDCIILDLIMSGIDGLKILMALRDRGTRIPVIIATADIQESVRKQCLDLGAAAFVHKPLVEAEFRNIVKQVLGQDRGRA